MPPFALTVIVPFGALQVVPVILRVDDSADGSVIVKEEVAVHPFTSVTTTWYVAGGRLLNVLGFWNVFPLSMLYCINPVPPLAEMDTEPLLDPKHVEFVGDTFAIAGEARLAIVADVVKLQPFASKTITL